MKLIRIGVVAGEASGDILGAGLIKALRKIYPDLSIEGIAGPKMIEAGCKALYPMERLAVVGLIEPLKRLPELFKIRRYLYEHFFSQKLDVFIGIDAPEFNLGLEEKLKKAGIPVVHYVSPSVWAWRKNRIHKIKRAVDLMLTLFPFETKIYENHQIPFRFVGHPLADQISLKPNQKKAREKLGLALNTKILGILPGSRATELNQMAGVFIQTALWCLKQEPDLQIITAMAHDKRHKQFVEILQVTAPHLPIKIFTQKSHEVMAASDALLLAAGTVTLEAMLLKRQMVVAYRMNPISFFILKKLVNLNYFSLPNLIANKKLVPEFIQKQVTPEILGHVLLDQLNDKTKNKQLINEYTKIHTMLRQDASQQAAKAVKELLCCRVD